MAGKKVLMVLPVRGFSEEEYRVVRYTIERRGHRVATAGIFAGSAESSDGGSVPVDMRLHDVKTYEYDGYVFLGGEGVRAFLEHPDARKLAKDITYKTIGATAEAVPYLAMAGAISKKRVTGPSEWMDVYKKNKLIYTGKPLEVDEKIITAKAPEEDGVSERFANAVASALA
jgi:putative intracellular protease/amidase